MGIYYLVILNVKVIKKFGGNVIRDTNGKQLSPIEPDEVTAALFVEKNLSGTWTDL